MTERRRRGPLPEIAVFGFGMVIGQALSAATTPVFTRILGPAEFGVLEVVTVFVTLVSTVLLAGLDQALIRSYYDDEGDRARTGVASTGALIVLGGSILVCAALSPFADAIGRAILGGGGYDRLIWAALASIPPAVGVAYLVELVRVERRSVAYTLLGVVRAVIGAVVGIMLVAVAGEGPTGVVVGLAAGSLAALVYGAVVVRRRLRPAFSRVVARRMLAFGLPLIPTGIAFWSLMVVDRLVLVHSVSLTQIGYYALGNKIALLLLWAVYGFRAGWTPVMLDAYVRDRDASLDERVEWLQQSTAVTAFVAALLGALSVELTILGGGHDFITASRVVPLILIAVLLFSTTIVVQSAMIAMRRTRVIARHTIAAAVLNLAVCLILVPPWGIYGAAVATIVGFVYLAVAFAWSAQKLERVEYDWPKIVLTMVLVAPYLALGLVQIGPLAVSIIVKVLAVAVFPFLLDRAGLLPVAGVASAGAAVRRAIGRTA